MYFDHLAEERQDRNFELWLHAFLQREPEQLAMHLAKKHRKGKTLAACLWKNGAFNVCYRVKYEDSTNVIVRFAALGRAVFRQEKTDNEVTVLRYLRQHTQVPVPEVYGSGTCWAGPYIVMAFVEGDLLSNVLKDPLKKEGRPVLNPRISDRALKIAYREMAYLVLELSKPQFSCIGALVQEGKDFVVGRRPLTLNMNELITSANLAPTDVPTSTFESAADYFEALAEQHLSHLRNQRNNAVTDEVDCQKKFVARCLFRKIVRNISVEHCHGPYRLYCDDFRPSNILVDVERFCVNAVIDWEFTYVAPAEFAYVAPWWLMLQSPEDWDSDSDLDDFLARYKPRLCLFLDVLRSCEDEKIAEGTLLDSQRLAARMEDSMESGLFWVCLAARYSSMFDNIYWNFLDKMYHGPFGSIEDRIQLLDEEERKELSGIFQVKVEQARKGILDEHYSTDTLVDL
jgi:aminoglycoside phosphotransferase (APT) family kinase protein